MAQKRLVLYSKEECPLCTKLESQIQSLIDRAQFMPSSMSDISFQVVDVTSKEELEFLADQVPILAKVSPNGEEARIPRFPPRITTDRLGKKLEAIFNES